MPNLQTHYHLKLDFQNVGQHTGDKWLIHGTNDHKDNQVQSLELSCRISRPREYKHDIKESKVTCSIQYSKSMHRDRNTKGGAYLQNQNYIITESLNT